LKNEFEIPVLDEDQFAGIGVNRTFHESDPIYGSNHFSSDQWRLNGSGDAVRVGLLKGDAYICEIKVFTFPGESHSATTSGLSVTKSFFRGMR
jgi:hypothetical protein